MRCTLLSSSNKITDCKFLTIAMRNHLKVIPRLLIFLAMFLTVFINRDLLANSSDSTLKFLFTSDLHGWLSTAWVYPERRHSGLLHLKKYITDLKSKHNDMFLIDAGDLLQGSPLVHFYHHIETRRVSKNPFFKLFNELNYDAVVVGNHDLSLNPSFEAEYVPNSNFSWLAANVYRGHTNVFKPYLVYKRNGIKVVILGFTTPGAHMWMGPGELQGIQIESLEKSVPKWIGKVRAIENPDFLLGVFHVGLNFYHDDENSKLKRIPPANSLRTVLEKNRSFDLVVSGHDHRLYPYKKGQKVRLVSGMPVISPGHSGQSATYVAIDLEKPKGKWKVKSLQAIVKKSKYSKRIASNLVGFTSHQYNDYINESLPWKLNPTSKEKVKGCINHLLAVSNDEDSIVGSFFPGISVFRVKYLFGRNLRRSDLFKWVRYDNKSVTVRLSHRDIELLTNPRPEFGSYKVAYNRKLIPWIKRNIGIKSDSFLPAKNDFKKQHLFKITDYHFWGGGGIRSKLFLSDKDMIAISNEFQRDQLFNFLKSATTLPKICDFLEFNPL